MVTPLEVEAQILRLHDVEKWPIGTIVSQLSIHHSVVGFRDRAFLLATDLPQYFLGQRTANFLAGHEAAFNHWNGCPRILLYDNLKSVVLERYGDAIRFNPQLLAFASHWRFDPRPVAIARGNEKGRVERVISYVRRSFFAARTFRDLEDLNEQASAWCDGPAMESRWTEDLGRTVADAYDEERPRLLPIPDVPFVTDHREELSVARTPYVRFDGNDYSVPHELARRQVTVLASSERVRILFESQLVAEHVRSFSRREQIEDPVHIEGLVQSKRRARRHRGFDRLFAAAPATRELMLQLAQRGENLGASTNHLLRLLDEYGANHLQEAITNVLQREVPHPQAVRQLLEQRRRAAGERPRIPVHLPQGPKVRDITVKPHDLKSYDELLAPHTSAPSEDCIREEQ